MKRYPGKEDVPSHIDMFGDNTDWPALPPRASIEAPGFTRYVTAIMVVECGLRACDVAKVSGYARTSIHLWAEQYRADPGGKYREWGVLHLLESNPQLFERLHNGAFRLIEQKKCCSSCREFLPLTEFYKCKATKDGHQYNCKQCCVNWTASRP